MDGGHLLGKCEVEKRGKTDDLIGKSVAYRQAFQMALVVKNLPANAGDIRDTGSIPGSGRSLSREWQPTPVFLPGESPWTEESGGL